MVFVEVYKSIFVPSVWLGPISFVMTVILDLINTEYSFKLTIS